MQDCTDKSRREDQWTAAIVQYAIALSDIVGIASAERYLLSRCVPLCVVQRVLSGHADLRRSTARMAPHGN
ncbi:hypothetical protein ACHMW6_18440 [Pseudoduganella sp. UC29_106]|uniref:hypothetical protein n=1 Tax=Pseudoduganella sp. UC29_106 TaxID=3374553 RepID=UPI003757930E